MAVFKKNDIIAYEPFGGGERVVRVIEIYADVKNGRPGFDGVPVDPSTLVQLPDAGSVWGFNSQLLRVIRAEVVA